MVRRRVVGEDTDEVWKEVQESDPAYARFAGWNQTLTSYLNGLASALSEDLGKVEDEDDLELNRIPRRLTSFQEIVDWIYDHEYPEHWADVEWVLGELELQFRAKHGAPRRTPVSTNEVVAVHDLMTRFERWYEVTQRAHTAAIFNSPDEATMRAVLDLLCEYPALAAYAYSRVDADSLQGMKHYHVVY